MSEHSQAQAAQRAKAGGKGGGWCSYKGECGQLWFEEVCGLGARRAEHVSAR